MIKSEVLSLLSCPICDENLQQDNDAHITCQKCKKNYPIKDEIVILLPEKAIDF